MVDVVADTIETLEERPVELNVLTSNDTFEGPATLTGVTQGANGAVTFRPDGSVTYTPVTDFAGQDSFTYTVTTDEGLTETTTVTVTVIDVADVVDGAISTNEDTAQIIDVLTLSGLGAGAEVSEVTQGSNGRVSIDASGLITYTPNGDFNGTDSFTYTVRTAAGSFETATITVTVNPVADIADDVLETNEDTAASLNVITNNDSYSGTVVISSVSQGSNGSVSFQADGTVTYTPNDGFLGADSFTYTTTDVNGEVETATVTVTVVPVNDPPSVTVGSPELDLNADNTADLGSIVTVSDPDTLSLDY